MSSSKSGNFLEYIQTSGQGASYLYGSGDANRPDGFSSGDLIYIDETASARGGGKGPPRPVEGGDAEAITDTYITGQNDGIDDSFQYNIQINFLGEWSDDLKSVFIASADYLASIIAEDVEDAVDGAGNTYDDLVITADLDAIDGEGGVLGQAGPTGLRLGTGIPAVGEMTFDEADALAYYEGGQFDDIVLHEMMHVMGVGTIWDNLGLVATDVNDNGTRKPTDDIISSIYTGTAANDAYAGEEFLLIETDGGSGTAGGHWDEDTYLDELMTGYIGYLADDGSYDATNYLSDWSVASLADLGYVLTNDAAGIADNIDFV